MAKQSILGRISQLLRANINALLDQAEDPQMMLDQLVRDYTNSIAEAEGDELRSGGNAADADKFDKLAKMAIGKQITAENEAKSAEPTIASQNDVVDKLSVATTRFLR